MPNSRRPTVQPLEGRCLLATELAFFNDGTFHFDTDRDGRIDDFAEFGAAGDQGLMADWDGDGRLDPVVFRGGAWSIDLDRDGVADANHAFGRAGDRALLADVDGDGTADPLVFDPSGASSVWRIDADRDGAEDRRVAFGVAGDRPFAVDWDGDGVVDLGVYRDGTAGGVASMQFLFDTAGDGGAAEEEVWFGVPGDQPFLGDSDGDDAVDAGTFRLADTPGGRVNQYFFDAARDGGAAEAEVWLVGGLPGDTAVLLPVGTSVNAGYPAPQGLSATPPIDRVFGRTAGSVGFGPADGSDFGPRLSVDPGAADAPRDLPQPELPEGPVESDLKVRVDRARGTATIVSHGTATGVMDAFVTGLPLL